MKPTGRPTIEKIRNLVGEKLMFITIDQDLWSRREVSEHFTALPGPLRPENQNAIEADAFTVRGVPWRTAGAKTSNAEAQ